MSSWLGLIIGNSRLHWAWFEDDTLKETWDTTHISEEIDSLTSLSKILPERYQEIANTNSVTIYLASVVPTQTALWCNYPSICQIELQDIPLLNTYNSLGIDRALAVYGAGETYHYPCLVIDGGTALTFTGVDINKTLIGGAILPGLRSQLRALNRQTAALPQVSLPAELPPRWALNTENAIASGVVYTIIGGIVSYIDDWLDKFPNSSIILTGGDSRLIFHYLQTWHSAIASNSRKLFAYYFIKDEMAKLIVVDSKLIFWGLRSVRKS